MAERGSGLFSSRERRAMRRAAQRYDAAATRSGSRLRAFYIRISGGDRTPYTDDEIRNHLRRNAAQIRSSADN